MAALQRDGVTLHVEEVPGNKPPLLLVHGWCCDLSFLAPQARHFARLCHRVVSVDLRGHGASDAPRRSYEHVFADDLAWICARLHIDKPIVVGHSMGGIVAYDLAKRHADVPRAIVMLDSAVALPDAVRAKVGPFLAALRGPHYRDTLSRFVEDSLFLPTDNAERRRAIIARMNATPQHVMVAAYEALATFDLAEGKTGPTVPCLYIQADEATPRSDLGRLLATAPQTMIGRVVGAGHFCQLEVPDQVNAMIERFIALLPAAGAPAPQQPT